VSENSGPNGGGRRLIIVESPAKAKTIAGYLGRGYDVESSIGHVRDLPTGAAEIPARLKKEPWSRLGVDVNSEFTPLYVVPSTKKAQVQKLKKALSGADELLLATDEDREGEAIAWHLTEVLAPRVPVHRMVFHEITPHAIREAVANPRDIDRKLVDAQETRRILDRLYGYEVSPVLWKKVMPRLSAGRVQSVATRLVVERERERMAFRAAAYWDITGVFDTGRTPTDPGVPAGRAAATQPTTIAARLVTVDGRRVVTGRDFGSDGALRNGDLVHLDGSTAQALADGLRDRPFTVRAVESRPYRRSPYAPFRTTTMQQEASRKLGFGAARTMSVAQRLYERGFITYMRTDSTTLSATAVQAARTQVRELYGPDYLPERPRIYDSKVKNAQEAHEAIRPAGDQFRTPAQTGLAGDEFRLYELIWKRTVASQMKDAQGRSVTVRIGATASTGEDAEFSASGKVITFHGFLKAYVEGADDPDTELDDRERRLPQVAEGDWLTVAELVAEAHETRPPARYTEASLVKELEDREIGRPSTYASILGTILDRGYVWKKGTALVPSYLAFAVVGLLEKHFAHLVDYAFTAKLEEALDQIANGDAQMVSWLSRFYFGENGEEGLKELVSDLGDIDAREVNSFPVGNGIVLRVGRYGPYLERGEDRANVPPDLAPDELTLDKAEELLNRPSGDKVLGTDPESGREIVAKSGRFGPYVTEVLPPNAPKQAKPRTASLFKTMTLDAITLDDAIRLLSLPRELGLAPDGEVVTALNGRYGPYVKKAAESRSLASEEEIFTVTLDQALALFAEPKGRRGRSSGATAAAPAREFGTDPVSGKPVVSRTGRYGPYVTDGETNASLPRGDDPDVLSAERAFELLAEKRAKGPAPARKRSTATGKKTAARKTSTRKSAAKKTAARRASTRKSGGS
jgi:DNA topoisomerase-1